MMSSTTKPMEFDGKWNEVDSLMNKPLLKDAKKRVDEIRVKAGKDNDELNTLKCEIYEYAIDLGCEYKITSDNNFQPQNNNREEGEDIIISHYKKASELLESFKSPAVKACCELYMAKMLQNFIEVMDREPGSVPSVIKDSSKKITAEGLREMSHENIRNLIRAHVDNIIKEKETLLSTSSEKYNSLFVKNDALTEEYKETHPSVFDAMLPSLISFYYERIEFDEYLKCLYLPIRLVKKDLLRKDFLNSIFADVINQHNSKNEFSAALSAELSRLQYLESYTFIEDSTKINTLDNLINQYYGKTPCVVNAVVKKQMMMCNSLERYNNNVSNSEIESYPKQIIEEAEKYMNLYPNHSGINELKKNIQWLQHPVVNGSVTRSTLGKGKNVNVNVSYANIDTLVAEIYQITLTPKEWEERNNNNIRVLLRTSKLIAKKEIKLTPTNYIINKDTVINIGNEFDYGKYIVVFNSNKNEEKQPNNFITFNISNLSLLDITSIGAERNIFVVDGETGHPVEGASVEKYLANNRSNELILKETQTTSSEGKTFISLPDKRYHKLHTQKGNDIYSQWNNDIYKQELESSYDDYKINILTDRNIYRPNQEIEGKVILTYLSEKDEHVVGNKKITLSLKDTNDELIEELEVTTNDFGSAPFKFKIPTDRLNGYFSIKAKFVNNNNKYYGNSHLSVEAYKLPAAKATLNVKDGSSIMFGDKVEFEGEITTFSGEALSGTTVKYRIEESGYGSSKVLFSGETKCNDDGKFTFKSDSVITKEMSLSIKGIIEAVLSSGETVSENCYVSMEERDVNGYIYKVGNGSNFIEKSTPFSYSVSLHNNAQKNKDAEAIISIFTKEDKEKNIASKTLYTKKIKGQDVSEKLASLSLFPAVYEIQLKSLTGDELAREEFVIYDKSSSKLPTGYESTLSILGLEKDCSSIKDAEILLGSSEKDAKILAIVRDEDGVFLNSEWIDVDNGQKNHKVSFKKYFANNSCKTVSVEYILVREFQATKKTVTIERKETKEKNEINILEIVRSIVPGEKQKVKVKVQPTSNSYEIAAVMVDKSLSGIVPNWNLLSHFYRYRRNYHTKMEYVYPRGFYLGTKIEKGSYQQLKNIKFLWDNINMSYMDRFFMCESAPIRMSRKAAPMMKCSVAADVEERSMEIGNSDMMEMEEATSNNIQMVTPIPPAAESTPDLANIKTRTNFKETAFFYPQLATAADGTVEFEYTAPDALTSWEMILFAHDKKVNSCITIDELQTRMPFAVKASLPRFVRKGDKCSFATTITNNDKDKKSGDVAIIIKDVATDKVISEQTRKFKVDGNKSEVEEWSFDVPAGVAAIEVKMVGKSETFSDGEIHQLPVLSDGTHVVKSKSMHVRGGETKDFSITYNEKEMKDAELTVEYTDNAVWQALMALPSVKDAKYDCATELISTIYANQMAQRIANLYPEIKSVIEEWKKEGNHIASPLEQNQELKNVLMQQTPWMYEAKNESEQRSKIVELYDENRITNANNDAISKLKKLQQADGGFAWFVDFKSSEYVTAAVVRRLVAMHEHGVLPKDCEKMLKDGVKYLDKKLAEAYQDEMEKKGNADREWVFDIFRIRISYDKNLNKETKKILDYYVAKAHKDIKDMTLYGKASFAIVLNMKGDKNEAKSIVESLRQSATNAEELGMYWKANQDRWGRYGNAIASHAMLIEAFKETGCDTKELSDLRFHLITKKETTQWSNTENTLAAIDALVETRDLASSSKNLASSSSRASSKLSASIIIGGKQVDVKRTSGDGYVKVNYDKETFTPELCNNIHIEQPKGQEGIGGIYISYDAPYSEITSGNSGIEVKKKMYKVVIANDGDDNKEMLQEIKDGEKLKKGDKVKIVMTLRSDRDLDFVQVLDLRAACLEPVRKRPGMEWADGKYFYQSITDSEYSMFFDRISKGTRVFEYTLHVTQSGEYTQGITKVIPHYCPAFSANSEGGKINVE